MNWKLPEQFRKSNLKKVSFQLNPDDEGLMSILKKFVQKVRTSSYWIDKLQVVHFYSYGIYASDTIKMIFIKGRTTEEKVAHYCATPKCLKKLKENPNTNFGGDGYEKFVDKSLPSYIHITDYQLDLLFLFNLLRMIEASMKNSKAVEGITDENMKVFLKAGKVFFSLSIKQLKEVVEGLVKIGVPTVYLHYDVNNKPLLFHPLKSFKDIREESFALLMGFLFDGNEEDIIDRDLFLLDPEKQTLSKGKRVWSFDYLATKYRLPLIEESFINKRLKALRIALKSDFIKTDELLKKRIKALSINIK